MTTTTGKSLASPEIARTSVLCPLAGAWGVLVKGFSNGCFASVHPGSEVALWDSSAVDMARGTAGLDTPPGLCSTGVGAGVSMA